MKEERALDFNPIFKSIFEVPRASRYRLNTWLVIGALCASSWLSPVASGEEPLRIVTTLPEFAEMARELSGGEAGLRVEVEALLRGNEDPHFVEALPSFVKRASRADLIVSAGLELENAWLSKVLAKSGHAQVQVGGPGYCELGSAVEVLQKPQGPITRAMGDVHASGNPHFYLSPLHLISAGRRLGDCMARLRPGSAQKIAAQVILFEKRMTSLHQDLLSKLATVVQSLGAGASVRFMEYHQDFTYLFAAYRLHSIGAIEEKPGVPPSAARIAKAAQWATAEGVRVALAATHHPASTMTKFSELSGVPHRRWPVMLQSGDVKLDRIEKLQRFYIEQLIEVLKQSVTQPEVKGR